MNGQQYVRNCINDTITLHKYLLYQHIACKHHHAAGIGRKEKAVTIITLKETQHKIIPLTIETYFKTQSKIICMKRNAPKIELL